MTWIGSPSVKVPYNYVRMIYDKNQSQPSNLKVLVLIERFYVNANSWIFFMFNIFIVFNMIAGLLHPDLWCKTQTRMKTRDLMAAASSRMIETTKTEVKEGARKLS